MYALTAIEEARGVTLDDIGEHYARAVTGLTEDGRTYVRVHADVGPALGHAIARFVLTLEGITASVKLTHLDNGQPVYVQAARG